MTMDFTGRVVLVTGSSRGLGKAFALCLAKAGATVVVNSTGNGEHGDKTVAEIVGQGGRAVHIACRVEDAGTLVKQSLVAAERLDAVIHNAGFVQDKTLRKMSADQWDAVLNIHLKSAFLLSKTAWPVFVKQGGGRLVFISSAAGLYGNFGQSNYAAAKMGLYGLCRTIALEGAKEDIRCNCVAPFGATEMNDSTLTDEIRPRIKPDHVAPLVAYLAHIACQETGGLFEAGAGQFKKLRWERSKGLALGGRGAITVDDVAEEWPKIVDFSSSEHPQNIGQALRGLVEGV